MRKRSLLQIGAGILLAGGGLVIFFRGVKTAELWHDLRMTPLWALAGVVVLTFLTLWIRSIRWNLILPPSKTASRRDLFGLVMISFMINNLIPARVGEAARMVLLWRRNGFTAAESIGSVLVERIIDSLVFFSFFFIPVFSLGSLRKAQPLALPMATATGAVVLLLLLYAFFPKTVRSTGAFFLKMVPQRYHRRVAATSNELASNLHWLFSLKRCLLLVVLSFCSSVCHAVMMMILVREAGFGLLGGMFAAATAALGASIPLSPGYVGTLHAALKEGLVMCTVATNKAIAVATLYHGVSYLTVTIAGLIIFFKMKISFKEIGRAKEELKQEKK